MRAVLFAAILLIAPLAVCGAQQGLNMSAIEALATIGHSELTGVFSYVPERDTPAAFSDYILRDEKARKKYLAKVEKDFKTAGGITLWDKAVLKDVVSFYGSPAAGDLKKPDPKMILKMAGLVSTPTVTIEQIQAKRNWR